MFDEDSSGIVARSYAGSSLIPTLTALKMAPVEFDVCRACRRSSSLYIALLSCLWTRGGGPGLWSLASWEEIANTMDRT